MQLLMVWLVLSLFPKGVRAAETPETILICQVLSNEMSARRRGDLDLVLQLYHERFSMISAHSAQFSDSSTYSRPREFARVVTYRSGAEAFRG